MSGTGLSSLECPADFYVKNILMSEASEVFIGVSSGSFSSIQLNAL